MKTLIRRALSCACTLLCIAIWAPAMAQVSDPAIYTAYVGTADAQRPTHCGNKVVAEKQEAFNKNTGDKTLRWNLVLAQYGLMGNTLRTPR